MNAENEDVFTAPDTRYFHTQDEFSKAVGIDFIKHANITIQKGQKFLVGLSHGKSPAGVYQYILDHYFEIKNGHQIVYTFVNSPLKSQEGLEENVVDAGYFLKQLQKSGRITKDQIIGRNINLEPIENYKEQYNKIIDKFLLENNKTGLDYAFLASNPQGRIAGIERNSKTFNSTEKYVIVTINKEKDLTITPWFLLKTSRVAFLATKSDKRRPLAWLYCTSGKANESPSFIRFIDNVEERLTIFIDDRALTWPEIEINRQTPYGISTIRLDFPNRFKENAKEKLPVILLIHGFLGLNSFDGLLTAIPSAKYIAAAMHYGSIPNDLPVNEYSQHIVKNIDAVVEYFGEKGHPVYIFDHSMSNIYFLMIDRDIDDLNGIKKYLKGRIGANPFFGEESKHALLGFLDNVIIPSMSFSKNAVEKSMMLTLRRIIPLDSRSGVRRRGINLSERLIRQQKDERSIIWDAMKERIIYLMTNMDSLPDLNRIPIEKALNKIPPKIFAIQIHSALLESKKFDHQVGLVNMKKNKIPVMILKSDKDGVAKFVSRLYKNSETEIIDITNKKEDDLFREHLYHMVNPHQTAKFIDEFITKAENVTE